MDQLRESLFGVAAVNVIHLRAAAHDLFGDVVLEACPSHDDGDGGVAFFERAGERDAGEGLLEDHGEPYQAEATPIDTLDAKINEGGCCLLANLTQIIQRATCAAADTAQTLFVDSEILFIVSEIAESRPRPDPLAYHARINVGDGLVNSPADVHAEVHEK